MPTQTLVSRIDTTIEEQLTPHTTLTSSYGDVCTDSHRALEADLSSIKAHHVNANSEKHRAVMQGAVKEGAWASPSNTPGLCGRHCQG